jgi:protein ImuB
MSLFACAWAAEFPAQALLRLRTDWQTEPVVVLDGRAPEEWVCSLNRLAERKGAAAGMTRLEAESMPGLRLLKRSAESEAAARAVMLECAAKFSPRIEEVGGNAGLNDASTLWASSGTTCAFVLDIAGTERLFGPPAQLAERLREELAAAGFRASIAVSANFHTARMKAASMRGVAVIPEGAEAEALAKLPIAALELEEEYAATFALWGIGTLGELAALPEAELVARMGPKAQRWRALARGEAEHTFELIEAEFALEEFCEFETPVEQIDSLLFMGARMIDCLTTRAAGRALALRSLTAEMGLEGGRTHGCAIRPAVPTIDRKFLLKLLQLEIGAHPPQAAVVRLTLRAGAGAQSKVQLGLFAPQTPEPSRLDVTLARLRAMVGDERVGSPVLEDTHRADGFRMEGFVNPGLKSESRGPHKRSRTDSGSYPTQAELGWGTPRMALRKVRPARAVRVQMQGSGIRDQGSVFRASAQYSALPGPQIRGTGGTQTSAMRPVAFSDGESRYEIAAAYGPWKTSGCWWAMEAWDTEEWDVLAVRAEILSSGAKAPIYFADHTARLKSCPDTSRLSNEISLQSPKPCHDSQPSDSACSSSNNDAAIACLLVRDCAKNVWRLEAFYD